MHAQLELNLAMVLFLPWFVILGALYWIYPRQPVTRRRRLFDASALVLATAAGLVATWWGVANADPAFGGMWRQVLASTLSYGAFLAVMTAAVFVRRRWILTTAPPPPAAR